MNRTPPMNRIYNDRRVYIDRLHLRVKGIAPDTARAALRDLGGAVLRQISRHEAIHTAGGTQHLRSLDAGTVRLEQRSPAAVRSAAARALAQTLADRLPPNR